MVRVNNPLLGPTDGGFQSGEEKAEKNKNVELKMTILKTFFLTQGEPRGSLLQVQTQKSSGSEISQSTLLLINRYA